MKSLHTIGRWFFLLFLIPTILAQVPTNIIPGGTFTNAQIDLCTPSKKQFTAKGLLKLTKVGMLDDVSANATLSVSCKGDGMSWDKWSITFSALTKLNLFQTQLPYTLTKFVYNSTGYSLEASMKNVNFSTSFAMTLSPPDLKWFKLTVSDRVDLTLPSEFPLAKAVEKSLSASDASVKDVYRFMQEIPIIGGYITFERGVWQIGGATKILDQFEGALQINLETSPLGVNETLAFGFRYNTFKNATMAFQVRPSSNQPAASFFVQIQGPDGLCLGKPYYVTGTIPPTGDWGLKTQLQVSGQAIFTCTQPVAIAVEEAMSQLEQMFAAYQKRDIYIRADEFTQWVASIMGLTVNVNVSSFSLVPWPGADAVTLSGSFSYDTITNLWSYNGTLDNISVRMGQFANLLNSSYTDTRFNFSLASPMRLDQFPFIGSLLKLAGNGTELQALSIDRAIGLFETTYIFSQSKFLPNTSFEFDSRSIWKSGPSTLDVAVHVGAWWLPNANPNYNSLISIHFILGETLTLTSHFMFGSYAEGEQSLNQALIGGTWKSDGSIEQVDLAGVFNATIPKSVNGFDFTKTNFSMLLQTVTPVKIGLFNDTKLQVDNVIILYDSVQHHFNLQGQAKVGDQNSGLLFSVAAQFDFTLPSRSLESLYLHTSGINQGFSFDQVPMVSGFTRALDVSSASSLVPKQPGIFRGAMDIAFTTSYNDTFYTFTDDLQIDANLATPWFSGKAKIHLTREDIPEFTPNKTHEFNDLWDLKKAQLEISSDYANVTITVSSNPCNMTGTNAEIQGLVRLPQVVNDLNMQGNASFTCNKDKSVESIQASANVSTGITLLSTTYNVQGQVEYKSRAGSATWAVKSTLDIPASSGKLIFEANYQNSSNWFVEARGVYLKFTDIPFYQEFSSHVDPSWHVDTAMIKGLYLKYQRQGLDERFALHMAFKWGPTDANATVILVKQSSTWLPIVDLRTGVYIPSLEAFIDVQVAANCVGNGVVEGKFGGWFPTMPEYLPNMINGSLATICSNGEIIWDVLQLQAVINHLGLGVFTVQNVSVHFDMQTQVFKAGWTLPPWFSVPNSWELALGPAIASPFGGQVRINGTIGKSGSVSDIEDMLKDLTGSPNTKLVRRASDSGSADFYNAIKSVNISELVVDFEASDLTLCLQTTVTAWGISARLIFEGVGDNSTSPPTWSFAVGIAMEVPTDPTQLQAMPDWLRGAVSWDGVQIEALFIGFANMPMTLTLPGKVGNLVPLNCTTGNFTANWTCLQDYSKRYTEIVPTRIELTSGGFGAYGKLRFRPTTAMLDIYQNTGDFGKILTEKSQGTLAFSIVIGYSKVELRIGLDFVGFNNPSSLCPSSSRRRAIASTVNHVLGKREVSCRNDLDYSGLAFVVSYDWNAQEFGAMFAFEITRTFGGQSITLGGGLGISLGRAGFVLDGKFYFDGTWRNPLYMAPALTIKHVDAAIGINLQSGIPTKFGGGFGASLDSPYGTMSVLGCMKLNPVNLGAPDNVLLIKVGNLSLANLIYGFVPNLGGEMFEYLNFMYLESGYLSVNFALVPAVMTECSGETAIPGIYFQLQNLNLFNGLFRVQLGKFLISPDLTKPSIEAEVRLYPFKVPGIVELVSARNPSIGARAYFKMDALGFSALFSAQLTLFGEIKAKAYVDVQATIVPPSLSAEIETSLNLWNMTTVDLYIAGNTDKITNPWDVLDAAANFRWTLKFEATSTSNYGLIMGLISEVVGRLNKVVQEAMVKWKDDVAKGSQALIEEAERAKAAAEEGYQQEVARWNRDVADANAVLEQKQAELKGLLDEANYWKRRCEGGEWWLCPNYWGVKAAYDVCVLGFNIAKGVLNDIIGPVGRGALIVKRDLVQSALVTWQAIVASAKAVVDSVALVISTLSDWVNQLIMMAAEGLTKVFYIQYIKVDSVMSAQELYFDSIIGVSIGGSPVFPLNTTVSFNLVETSINIFNAVGPELANYIGGLVSSFGSVDGGKAIKDGIDAASRR